MQRLKRWLRTNGFKIVREGTGPEGVELTVLAESGRVVQLVLRPRTDPQSLIETLAGLTLRHLWADH